MKRFNTRFGAGPRAGVAMLLSAASLLYAQKNPDKPDKPDKRIEKIERKLERAAVAAELSPAASPRQAMGATAPEGERQSRSDRDRSPDRSSSDRPSRRSDRGEYREPTTPADAKYDSFRIIVERNIFNPTRVGRTRDRSEERAPRVDTIALVGTMHSDKGVVAFFDSPDSAFRKTLRVGQSVGDFKVEKISAQEVDLSRDGKPLTLQVAQQLRRPEGGDWTVSAVERQVGDSPGTSGAEAARPAEPPPIPPDASDALRRLMEARQKQLKQ